MLVGAGKSFYLDANEGDDTSEGTSPATAWKSLEALERVRFDVGCTIYFKRGCTFKLRKPIRLDRTVGRGLFDCVKLDAYGVSSDPLPRLSGWWPAKSANWQNLGNRIWAIDTSDALSTQYLQSIRKSSDVARLRVDGEIKTNKKQSLDDLKNPWDYFSNHEKLYIYLAGPPSDSSNEIDLSFRINAFENVRNAQISNLWIEGVGGHGASIGSNVEITRCVFHTIGGSLQEPDTRYGNGVEVWRYGENIRVNNNLFWECYDAALTCQGYDLSDGQAGWSNVDLSDNWICRCAQGLEIWATCGRPLSASRCPDSRGFLNVRAKRLRLFDIGRGASRAGRLNYKVWSCLIQTLPNTTSFYPVVVSIEKMRNCSDTLLFGPISGEGRGVSDFFLEPSNLSLPVGSQIARGFPERVEDWSAFVRKSGIGTGSTMTIEPSSNTGFENTKLLAFEEVYSDWLKAI